MTSHGAGCRRRAPLLILPCLQELQLPKSIITRLAKGVLPPNTQIQANAILAMTKSATVFINHLANAYDAFSPPPPRLVREMLTRAEFLLNRANEVTSLQNKKTIMPADVFRALDDIEFGFMRERVEAEFASAPYHSPTSPAVPDPTCQGKALY